MITTLDMKPGDLVWLGEWAGKPFRRAVVWPPVDPGTHDDGPAVVKCRVWPASDGGWIGSGPGIVLCPTRAEAEAERALLAHFGITAPAPADLAGLAAREAT